MTRTQRFPDAPSRRRVLQALAAGTAGALAGCSLFDSEERTPGDREPPAEATREPATGAAGRDVPGRLASEYDRAVNVVAAGADNTGSEPVESVLESELGDDTLLYFPRGEYRFDGNLETDSVSNLGFVGDRALFRPPQGFAATLLSFGTDGAVRDLRFEGIDFDVTAERTGARPLHCAVDDGLLVRDVGVTGRQDVDHDGMRFDVTDENGTGRVENVRLPDGGSTAFPNTGIYVGEESVGELSFVGCQVAGWPDNGLYASPAQGPVQVLGGHYANNGISGVRVSGESLVRNVRVTCNTTRSGLENMRGIRLREGGNVTVENATVEMRRVTGSDGAITMAEWLESATVRDTHLRIDADDVPAINAKRPTDEIAAASGDEPSLSIRNVRTVGGAGGEATISVAGRNRCRFENLCVHQRGRGRNGIHLSDSEGNVVARSTVDVTGDPLVLENATAQRRRFRTGASLSRCQ
ncbi:right-handed parallel beta-helix repeat-containing protein [Halorientalis halophila]|uniref:right-handed parallel beta-helix repeat-containing protein n=1 Tax=Halorientalis halophila TaxID=3108499 RepID=UPI003008AC57